MSNTSPVFFDISKFRTLRSKIQFKRPISRFLGSELYYFIPLRFRKAEIYVKTPKLVTPWGLNIYETSMGTKQYYYTVSFTDQDIDPQIALFVGFLRDMEDFCQTSVVKFLVSWLGADWDPTRLKFKSYFNDPDHDNPLYRFKILTSTEIYNEKDEIKPLQMIETLLTPQCLTLSLLQPDNIWITSTEYGLTWKVHQFKIYPSHKPFGGISFLTEKVEVPDLIVPPEAPPMAPPLAPPLAPLMGPKSRIPIGGVSMLPFLSSITSQGFNLKKTETQSRKGKPQDGFPEIDLAEILKIRNRLKKIEVD